jgi:ketosteroid isomerase-like protein
MPSNPVALVLFIAVLAAGDHSRPKGGRHTDSIDSRSDSTEVVRTASRFHDALRNGDTAAVKNLIASDLRVLEGGEVENRAQYLAHHLAADIEFAKAVRSDRTVVSYTRQGKVAWLVSTSTATGKFNGRDINSVGAELMILSQSQKGWQIRAVQWSSTRRQTP